MLTPKQYHEKQPANTVAFGKTLIALDFDEKLTQNNISLVKKRCSPAFGG